MGNEFTLAAAPYHANGEMAADLRDAGEQPFASVAVHTEMGAALADWAELEAVAPISVYQTRRWLVPWIETIGAAAGMSPFLAVAVDGAARPVALLPFGVVRRGAWRTAVFLGGKDANLNLGLFRPGLRWSRSSIEGLLRHAARGNAGPVSLYALHNQPLEWNGAANPLAQLPSQPSPSFSALGALGPCFDAAVAGRLSADARKKLRKKANRLQSRYGTVRHLRARDAATVEAVLNVFHEQKAARMRDKGLSNVFDDDAMRRFLLRAATEGLANDCAGIEVHALLAGEQIVATFGGAGHGGRFSGMFNSFATDVDIARSSPGDLLVLDVIAEKCAEGFSSFDLGIGEASYKGAFCDQVEPLFDAMLPITPTGHAVAAAASLQRRVKRHIKQTPWMWSAIGRLRRFGAGKG